MLLEGQRFNTRGTNLWGLNGVVVHETAIVGFDSRANGPIGAVPDGDGGTMLIFTDRLASRDRRLNVFAQRVTTDVSLVWESPRLVGVKKEEQRHKATIVAPGSGAFVIVAQAERNARFELLVFRIDSGGQHVWSSEGGRATLNFSDSSSDVFGVFDGEILRLAWNQRVVYPDASIRTTRFDLEGNRLDPMESVAVSDAPGFQRAKGLVFSPLGRSTLFVWNQIPRTDSPGGVYGAVLEGQN